MNFKLLLVSSVSLITFISAMDAPCEFSKLSGEEMLEMVNNVYYSRTFMNRMSKLAIIEETAKEATDCSNLLLAALDNYTAPVEFISSLAERSLDETNIIEALRYALMIMNFKAAHAIWRNHPGLIKKVDVPQERLENLYDFAHHKDKIEKIAYLKAYLEEVGAPKEILSEHLFHHLA